MLLDASSCYRAIAARDARFDGRFFVGVATTRIYCRPVCSARTPRPSSCSFFPSAAAAEASGYRPCLRCRPELAPGWSSVDASRRLAFAVAGLIEEGVSNGAGLEKIASGLGATSRHLRRVFRKEFGVSPVEFAQTQRLLLAKRLLTDTALPTTDVAASSGFRSLRRFHALFRERYRMTPTDLRRERDVAPAEGLKLSLGFRPPYAWKEMLEFLEARAIPGVERVADGAYLRAVSLPAGRSRPKGWIRVTRAKRRDALDVTLSPSLARSVPAVLVRVRRLFDLSCGPDEVGARLGQLARGARGLRVPGAFDGLEMVVRAILGQQITVRGARTLAGRIAERFGEPVETPFDGVGIAFPTAERLAQLGASDLGELGVVRQRGEAILRLARALRSNELRLDPHADLDATLDALRAVPGVGEWTVQYIAMRALAWPDAFPHTDLGVKKALGENDPAKVLEIAEAWRPWRAYAAIHLWRSLAEKAR